MYIDSTVYVLQRFVTYGRRRGGSERARIAAERTAPPAFLIETRVHYYVFILSVLRYVNFDWCRKVQLLLASMVLEYTKSHSILNPDSCPLRIY
eukprot:COSAG02_NODE_13818_length_1343_cov_2.037781_1_plen_94_part_00